MGANRLFDKNGFTEKKNFLIFLHLAGILLFGLLPFFVSGVPAVPFFYLRNTLDMGIILLLIILTVFFSIRLSRKQFFDWEERSTSQGKITTSYFFLYFICRILFIAAYEIWFRGFLLSDSV